MVKHVLKCIKMEDKNKKFEYFKQKIELICLLVPGDPTMCVVTVETSDRTGKAHPFIWIQGETL